ncbi:MAG: malate synthase A, partial [Gammaproteobacteria bacterium]|nr:malate synthase A [Gammaproteobacteria bacterium]
GCVPMYNLMEDAATAEICRAQLWQWIRHAAQLDDGRSIDRALVRALLQQELDAIRARFSAEQLPHTQLSEAAALFE